MRQGLGSWCAAAGTVAALALSAERAEAFCGFYVSGADAKLFNNATLVVLMREGTRTVLSMQNAYQGPPQNFAMVVPVPVVLEEANVKTLPREIFARVDQLAAPRLVEYWEQDPCAAGGRAKGAPGAAAPAAPRAADAAAEKKEHGVTVEAQFTVGEYEIVILSAKDSTGLDTWLKENKYKIPDGAEPALRPYVESGMKFFVAKVNVEKVKFEHKDGKDVAMLSPLRFHYDTDTFSLPVRLGLLNSGGTQDLIVHILAPQKRYQVSNYPNVTIPTNLDVAESARGEFGAFYAALFDKTLEQNPKAVVTEYSWDAQSCDPCPSPPLHHGELMTLGADVLADAKGSDRPRTPRVAIGAIEGEPNAARGAGMLQGALTTCYQRALESDPSLAGKVTVTVETDGKGDVASTKVSGAALNAQLLKCATAAFDVTRFDGVSKRKFAVPIDFRSIAQPPSMAFTLTRLHARYGKESLGEDLVFREAPPIQGGREVRPGGKLEQSSAPGSINNFQGRYAIRHAWTGDIKCANPVRGVWGGPPPGKAQSGPQSALDLAFAPRGKTDLVSFLRQDVPELKLKGPPTPAGQGDTSKKTEDDRSEPSKPRADSGCACEAPAGTAGGSLAWALGLVALVAARLRRRS